MTEPTVAGVLDWLRGEGVGDGGDVGLAMARGVGVGFAVGDEVLGVAIVDPAAMVATLERTMRPRWIWWDRTTADVLAEAGISVLRCWDVLTVHRLLSGEWRTSVPTAWASLHDLAQSTLPSMGQLGLLDDHGAEGDDPEQPVRPDGHLRPEWTSGGWASTPDRLAAWARLAARAASSQRHKIVADRGDPERVFSTARSESAAELLCAELTVEGLPVDVAEAERIIGAAVGERPRDEADAAALRSARDDEVLRLAPPGTSIDLRNPAQVRAMLRRVGVDVPDTRAWRLEQRRTEHPLVEALLGWRKAERIATTYGYRWLDEHVRGGRLRGEWSSSDGAAGRMTASSGLHNLPADLRPAVAADPGWVFVRADLGQIEPRVLAAVSGDPALIVATQADDLYRGVATRLGVERPVAKVAVLGAMYGATTGTSARALGGLEQAYPRAMGLLAAAAARGQVGDDVFTIGGRRVCMWSREQVDAGGFGDIDRARSAAAARGRYARNALIQGAAAEFFKVWAVTVRVRGAALGARIVLCLHDELLLHVPAAHGDDAAAVLVEALGEAAYRWSPERAVRFVAEVSVIRRWSDAK